jgi:hypothetical protein
MPKEFTVDFSSVPSSAALPEGRYPIVVNKVTSFTAQTGTPKLTWALEVTEGEFAGRRLTMQTSLHPNSLWFLRQLFEKLDIFQESMRFVTEEDTLIEPDLVGKVAIAVVSQEEYQGVTRNRVTDLLPITSSAPVKTPVPGSSFPMKPGVAPASTAGRPASKPMFK